MRNRRLVSLAFVLCCSSAAAQEPTTTTTETPAESTAPEATTPTEAPPTPEAAPPATTTAPAITSIGEGNIEQYEELSLADLLAIPVEVASTKAQTIFNTPSTVSVVDRATIERYAFRSVSEALTLIPAAQITRDARRQAYSIRSVASGSGQLLVLIDGVPTFNAITIDSNLERINIHEVERIEVLRGPASVLYGSNAYGGAINIVLRKTDPKKQKKLGGFVHGEAGESFSAGGGGGVMHSDGPLNVIVSGHGTNRVAPRIPFDDTTGTPGLLNDYQRSADFSMQATYSPSFATHSFLINAYEEHHPGFSIGRTWGGGLGADATFRGVLADYTISKKWSSFEVALGGGYDLNREFYIEAGPVPLHSTNDGHRWVAHLRSILTATDWLEFEAGGDFETRFGDDNNERSSITNDVLVSHFVDGERIGEGSVYLQGKLGLGNLVSALPLTFLVGARYTANELYGGNLSLRGSLTWLITETQSLKFMAGQAFRSPGIFNVFFQLPPFLVSNPAARPETTDSIELAYLLGYKNFFVQALGYYARYLDLIGTAPQSPLAPFPLTWSNVAFRSARGFELELKFRDPSVIDVFVTYGFQSLDMGSVDPLTAQNLTTVPNHIWTAGASRDFGPVTLSSKVRGISSQGTLAAPQLVWDAALSYRRGGALHQLTINNILNDPYEYATFYQVPTGFNVSIIPATLASRHVMYRFVYDF